MAWLTESGWLPLPANRVALRTYVARTLLERQGLLPEFRNA